MLQPLSAIGEIVAGVGDVSRLVEALCRTSAEQSAGVLELSRTVTEVDQMTRQNAALVEQSAIAADSLRDQATLAAVASHGD